MCSGSGSPLGPYNNCLFTSMYSPNGKLKSFFTGVTCSGNMGNPGNILTPLSLCSFEETIDLWYVVTTLVFAVRESHVRDSSGPLYLLPSPFPSRELVKTGTRGLFSSAASATSATSSKAEDMPPLVNMTGCLGSGVVLVIVFWISLGSGPR